jgi:hypothetical protein
LFINFTFIYNAELLFLISSNKSKSLDSSVRDGEVGGEGDTGMKRGRDGGWDKGGGADGRPPPAPILAGEQYITLFPSSQNAGAELTSKSSR